VLREAGIARRGELKTPKTPRRREKGSIPGPPPAWPTRGEEKKTSWRPGMDPSKWQLVRETHYDEERKMGPLTPSRGPCPGTPTTRPSPQGGRSPPRKKAPFNGL